MNVRVRRFFPVLLSILILSLLLLAAFRDAAISVANRIWQVFRGADPTSSSGTVQAGISSTRAVEAGLLSEGITRAGKRYYAVTVDLNRSTVRLFYKMTATTSLLRVLAGWKNGWLTGMNDYCLR